MNPDALYCKICYLDQLIQNLIHKNNTISRERNGLLATQQEVQEVLDKHSEMIQQKDADTQALIRALVGINTSTATSPPHPDSDKFTGDKPKLLPEFVQAMSLKLKQNADWYPSEQHKMRYFVSRLKRIARSNMDYGIQADGSITFDDIDAIIKILTLCFGNIKESKSASTELLKLKQDNKPLIMFLPEWIALANKVGWEESTKIALLRNALSKPITSRLSYIRNQPTDFVGFITFVREEDNAIWSVQARNHPVQQNHQPPSTTTATATSNGDTMVLDAGRVVWTGSNGGKKRPQNQAERDAKRRYCYDHELCLYCESPQHKIDSCPVMPPKPNYSSGNVNPSS